MVDLLPNPEQESIIDMVQSFLRDKLPVERLRPQGDRPAADDRAHWQTFAEFGWFGLGLPEDLGGTGASVAEEMIAFREFGRSLLTPSVFATVMAAHVLQAARRTKLAENLVAGRQGVCLANILPGDGGLQVFDARPGDLILAVGVGRLAVFETGSINLGPMTKSLDTALTVARVAMPPDPPLAAVSGDGHALVNRASILLSAMLAGIAEATRDMAVEYAKLREQFGQPIGGFQAIKHHCVDMAARADAAQTLTAFAALCVEAGRGDATFQSASARIVAADAAIRNAATNIQVHGGIGFTAECDANLYLKRAHILERIGGATRAQQRLLAAQEAAE